MENLILYLVLELQEAFRKGINQFLILVPFYYEFPSIFQL